MEEMFHVDGRFSASSNHFVRFADEVADDRMRPAWVGREEEEDTLNL